MKKMIKIAFISIVKFFMKLFYDKHYLRGRWFDDSTKGWRWCWQDWFMQKIVGYNRNIPFPVSHRNIIRNYKNLIFHVDDLNNFQHFGCYFQNSEGKIIIGKGTYIAPNVGFITQNHKTNNLDEHDEAQDIIIGKNCWIGMNTIILPGVELGDRTIVGAGAVVSKSFKDGNCVIVGNPANMLRKINKID